MRGTYYNNSSAIDEMITNSVIGLYNPKFDANVGSVLRNAFCFGNASAVFYTGKRVKSLPTDTNKAWRTIPLINTDDIVAQCPYKHIPVAVEIVDDCTPLARFCHPKYAYYIFGPEDGSLPSNILNCCAEVVSIPTDYCLNLAVATGVVLYDRKIKNDNN